MNRPSNILPFPVDYAPSLYDSIEERERIDRIIADIRRDERMEKVSKVLTVLFAIAVVYGLLVGGLVVMS